MNSEVFYTNSSRETFELGKKMGEKAGPGEVYALVADLGCGKTVFSQGFAAGLGVKGHVSSPTFTLLKSYDSGRLPFHHFDVYRIGDISEMDEIGYEECFYSEGVSVVEWAELIEELLPEDTVFVRIEKEPEKGFDHRRIQITGPGSQLRQDK